MVSDHMGGWDVYSPAGLPNAASLFGASRDAERNNNTLSIRQVGRQ